MLCCEPILKEKSSRLIRSGILSCWTSVTIRASFLNGELLVSRDGKLVAKVVVRSIEKDRSIANVVPGWKLGEVIEGDEVSPAHPAS
jgi:hypothetical protein